ncbi:diguanylate cyclase [Stenotrophomonas rhizophila]|nr:diguanylate cyclase [Stenotrophomonas rhizophila]
MILTCIAPVGAGKPANQATRWMARASPVFAGEPAPTGIATIFRD